MSRRKEIELDPDEVIGLLAENYVAVVSTNGQRGWPHSMPLWYVEREGEVWAWTFGKSQKVKNLERDSRATVLIEAGDTYAELRGVMFEAETVIHRDPEIVGAFAAELGVRYADRIGVDAATAPEVFAPQVPKRVALQFRPVRTATWDHRKLAGTY
ncbi:MAG: pyridoxamine 5'-phosphate oxidase family protein [Thermoleophilia bacterium]|nr:pyridoxamine 5'-phosphate oxidase family protein [Thermoleophilia bacterium]